MSNKTMDLVLDATNFKVMERNLLELINKVSLSANSDNDTTKVTWVDKDGKLLEYDYPNIGSIRKELEHLKKGINKVAGNNLLELHMENGKKKIFKATNDHNMMYKFDEVSNQQLIVSDYFSTKNNWFFNEFLNPLLYVNIDITSRYKDVDVNEFAVRRVILLNLNDNALDVWNNNIMTVKDWDYNDIISLLDHYNIDYIVNDDNIKIPYGLIKNYGKFKIISNSIKDFAINGKVLKKNFYQLDTISYKEVVTDKMINKHINVGDVLIGSDNSEFVVKEVDVDNKRIVLERINGHLPLAIGDELVIKPDKITSKHLNINIGYNERSIIFIKPIEKLHNVSVVKWSKGYPIYSNELYVVMRNGGKISLKDFYDKYVSDFGLILTNMAKNKNVPAIIGMKPNKPKINSSDFKVVRVNEHLKSSPEVNKIKEKMSIKTNISSEIMSIDRNINDFKQKLNTVTISSGDKKRIVSNIKNLVDNKNVKIKQYESVVKEIDAGIKDQPGIVIPNKYKIRGFWSVPSPRISDYGKQEIIGFVVSYRYLNSGGYGKNPDEFKIMMDSVEKTAYYSEWHEIKTKIRQKKYNEFSGLYEWENEDLKNPDIVNFNQIEIPITKSEIVEIRIRSISEAGWPDNLLLSDWSNIIKVSFDSNIINMENTENIYYDILIDTTIVELKKYLNELGIDTHLMSNVEVDGKTYLHTTDNILSNIEELGKVESLTLTLKTMLDKIKELENSAIFNKGEIEVNFIDGNNIVNVNNGDIIRAFAGYYKDIIDNTAFEDGSIITKTYNIQLTNKSNTPIELVARMGNGLTSPVGEIDNDTEYSNNRKYHEVPIVITDQVNSELDSYLQPSPFQSNQVKSQFVFFREKNFGLNEDLYILPDNYDNETYDFLGIDIDNTKIPYAGYGHYLPYDPTKLLGLELKLHQYVWNGEYNGDLPKGGGYLSEFCIHVDHPILKEAKLNEEQDNEANFENLVRPPYDGHYPYHNFAHGINFEITEHEVENKLGGKYYMQTAKYNPPKYVSDDSEYSDKFLPVKIGFVDDDEYLIGKYTCGAYLYPAVTNHSAISVNGNHPTLSTRKLIAGKTNSINIPIIFQFRATDKLGYVGGYRVNEILSNVKYVKKIGLDIYIRGNNPLSYGEVFSFDIEVSGQYKSNLNVVDTMYVSK